MAVSNTTLSVFNESAVTAPSGTAPQAADSAYVAAKEKVGKWMYLSDPEALEIVLATAVAIYLPGDPLWTLLVGPSGGGKTEMLRMFADSDDAEIISKLTPHTLLSGLKDIAPGADLIHTLNDKLLVIKDLAPILELGKDNQKEILSDLRDAYDGLVVKAWGSGKAMARWQGKFGLIAAATPAIDKHWKFFAELGERFVRVNLRTDSQQQTSSALERLGDEDEMRRDLRQAGSELLSHYKESAQGQTPTSPLYFRSLVGDIAYLTSVLRTGVMRDRYHSVVVVPQPEVGTRVGKQLLRLAESVALLNGREEPGDHEFDLVLRAVSDAMPARRAKTLSALLDGKETRKAIEEDAGIPVSTIAEELEDLFMLGVVTEVGKVQKSARWQIRPEFAVKLDETGLADVLTRKIPPADA